MQQELLDLVGNPPKGLALPKERHRPFTIIHLLLLTPLSRIRPVWMPNGLHYFIPQIHSSSSRHGLEVVPPRRRGSIQSPSLDGDGVPGHGDIWIWGWIWRHSGILSDFLCSDIGSVPAFRDLRCAVGGLPPAHQ